MSKKNDLETTAKEEAVEQEFFAKQAEKPAQPEPAPEPEKPPTQKVSTWRTSSSSEGEMTWEQFRNLKLTT
jgi:hypothetical protein